jgi:signal transduction histidine kinase
MPLAAIDRNQNLNLFMRNFADLVRLPEPNKKNTDLHKIIHAVAALMEMRAGSKGIKFQFDLTDIPYHIMADEQQMEQVLINIVKNAIEAIEEEVNISFTINHTTKQLKIADSGKGIPPSITEQLFSPFFSTKKDGQGIGLTLIRNIAEPWFEFSLKTLTSGRTEFIIQLRNQNEEFSAVIALCEKLFSFPLQQNPKYSFPGTKLSAKKPMPCPNTPNISKSHC